MDTIDLGPERRSYLEHKLERVWEINSQVRAGPSYIIWALLVHHLGSLYSSSGLFILPYACPRHQRLSSEGLIDHPCCAQGSIPYVPYLRAPYYIWIGQIHQTGRECCIAMKP